MLVIDVALFHKKKTWSTFGVFGTTTNYIIFSLHTIAEKFDSERKLVVLFLHAFSGCDTVSSLFNLGKRTMWETGDLNMTHMTAVVFFSQLSSMYNLNNVSMELNVISQQIIILKHVIISSIIWRFTKRLDYPSPELQEGLDALWQLLVSCMCVKRLPETAVPVCLEIGRVPWCTVSSCLLGKSEIAGSNPTLAFKFQRNKIFLPRLLVMIQYCGKSPWLRGSLLVLRPPGREFRILCLEGSVISFIAPSSGGYPGLV